MLKVNGPRECRNPQPALPVYELFNQEPPTYEAGVMTAAL